MPTPIAPCADSHHDVVDVSSRRPPHCGPRLRVTLQKGTGMAGRVLIVDDEPAIRTVLDAYLTADGFAVEHATSGADALNRVLEGQEPIDLILLDVGLPDLSGIEVLTTIRARSQVSVILVTARAEEVDKLVGLRVGADDYITKPFSPREVVARVHTVLRRVQGETTDPTVDPALCFDGLRIDPVRREVRVRDHLIELSALDFDLLWALASSPGRVFSRSQLLEKVWGYDFYGDDRVVDVHIRSVRAAMGDDATSPSVIGTVRGVGYKFLAHRVEKP